MMMNVDFKRERVEMELKKWWVLWWYLHRERLFNFSMHLLFVCPLKIHSYSYCTGSKNIIEFGRYMP